MLISGVGEKWSDSGQILDLLLDLLFGEREQKKLQVISRYFCYVLKGMLFLTCDRMDME